MNSPETPVKFRATRKRLGMSQADLAKALGMTRSQVSRMENGTVPIIKRTALALLALALLALPAAHTDRRNRHDSL